MILGALEDWKREACEAVQSCDSFWGVQHHMLGGALALPVSQISLIHYSRDGTAKTMFIHWKRPARQKEGFEAILL